MMSRFSHFLWWRSADTAGKNIRKICGATCMTLRISFDGNTLGGGGAYLFFNREAFLFRRSASRSFSLACSSNWTLR